MVVSTITQTYLHARGVKRILLITIILCAPISLKHYTLLAEMHFTALCRIELFLLTPLLFLLLLSTERKIANGLKQSGYR